MSEQQSPTFWITGYLPNGCKVSYTVPIDKFPYGEALAFTDELLRLGFTTNEPGLNEGESGNAIVTVMRRAKSDGTPIIDFFTEWGHAKEGKKPWGTFKYLHLYMNSDAPEMVTEFLKVSGFKSLEDIPLYDAQAPLQRDQLRPHPKETKVPTPFKIIREQGEEKIGSDGQTFRPWNFVRYETIGGQLVDKSTGEIKDDKPIPNQIDDKDVTWNAKEETAKQLISAISMKTNLTGDNIFQAIKMVTNQKDATKWSQFKNITRADVWAAALIQRYGNDDAFRIVKDDEVLTKAVSFWVTANTPITGDFNF